VLADCCRWFGECHESARGVWQRIIPWGVSPLRHRFHWPAQDHALHTVPMASFRPSALRIKPRVRDPASEVSSEKAAGKTPTCVPEVEIRDAVRSRVFG